MIGSTYGCKKSLISIFYSLKNSKKKPHTTPGMGLEKELYFMHQNTATTVTQNPKQSNFFEIPSDKIAYSGILERIRFDQWHIFNDMRHITQNMNLINFAALLAVFPRMGIYAYRIPQSAIAEKMGELFNMPVPARNTISKWEKELEKLGFLEIPKHVDWRRSKTKIRVIKEKFWELSRKGLEKLSYTCPHVTQIAGTVERVIQVNPKVLKDPILLVTKIRAREPSCDQPVHSHAGHVQKNEIGESKKFSRPPKDPSSAPRKLNKFENSVCHWFFQNRNIGSYREKVILFAKFLQLPATDGYLKQLQRNWADCSDVSRPGLVTMLIDFLSALDTVVTAVDSAPPLSLVSEKNDFPRNVRIPNTEKEALLSSMMFGNTYAGGHWNIYQQFLDGSEEHKDWMFENLDRLIVESSHG